MSDHHLPAWLPLVSEGRVAAGGDKLRHWGISETWRIRWADGSSSIVKRGAGDEALALDVYEELLIPYAIDAPRLTAAHRGDGFVVLGFVDVGPHSLAERPSAEGWIAAARLLARLRTAAQSRLGTAAQDRSGTAAQDRSGTAAQDRLGTAARFRFGLAEIVGTRARAADALAAVRPDLAGALDACEPLLAPSFERLTRTVPETIIHGDFEAKNIVLGGTGPVAVDWSAAQVGSHLGDLYGLIRDAGLAGGPVGDIVAAYADEAPSTVDLEWQLALGGVAWTLRALRWVLEEGIHVVPESTTWIDELVERAGNVTADLRRRQPISPS
ncbi:phosphotransferase [Actinoplanes sp. NPDC049265]|uniref:phosphotransferase n=1 Tax=Actinoplanes sp. NPDC049265 TaxID=3363902 RepID=UPI0037146679